MIVCAFGDFILPSSSEKSIHLKTRNSRVASRVPDYFLTLLTSHSLTASAGGTAWAAASASAEAGLPMVSASAKLEV